MTNRHSLGRHRAESVRTNPLDAVAQAVSSNAGSVGRQAAVVAAASGLIVTLGVPGQASAPRDVSAAPVDTINPERVAVKAVSVPEKKADDLEIERVSFSSKPAPKPVVVATAAETPKAEPKAEAPAEAEADAGAPMTRENASQWQGQVKVKVETPKVSKETLGNLSGIAASAVKYEGSPYVWGGNTPSGWDCSGFVKYVYAEHGIDIARGTSAILASGQFKRTSSPKPGDLVFQNGGGHVGIYLGNGKMIGAQNPNTGTFVHDVTRNPLYGYYTLAR